MIDENEERKKRRFFHAALTRKDSSFANYINILFGYMDTVFLYNLFFIALSLGIVTIGPALVAMNACYNDLLQSKTDQRYRKFFRYFKENFNWANAIMGIVLVGILAGCTYLVIFFATNYGKAIWLIVPWVFVNFLAVYSVTLFAYYALMKVRMDLPTATIIRNAFLLTSGAIVPALLCLLSFGVLFVLPLVFWEYCWPLFVLLLFAWLNLSLMMSIDKTVDQYVIVNPDSEEEKEEDHEHPHLRLDLIDDPKPNPKQKKKKKH